MRFRVWSAVFAALVLTVAPIHAFGAEAPSDPTERQLAMFIPGDNDDDGLGDEMDPDDDNDGIPDDQDSAPFDPLVPGSNSQPIPDPGGFDQDTDGDGITNNADPDDNNDGVVDGQPQPPTAVPTESAIVQPTTVPTTVPTPAESATQTPVAPSSEPVAEAPAAPEPQHPVVTSLPSTGTGNHSGLDPIGSLVLGMAFLIMSAASWRSGRRR